MIRVTDAEAKRIARIHGCFVGVSSVANLTRRDGEDLLELSPKIPIRTEVVPYPLTEANAALADLRGGRLSGAAVLMRES